MPTDWVKLDRELIEAYHLKPWELDKLTLTEILVLYCKRSNGTPFTHLWKKLTPEDKLRVMQLETYDGSIDTSNGE